MSKKENWIKISDSKKDIPDNYWKPDDGETYYFVTASGYVTEDEWHDSWHDKFKFYQGNLFKRRWDAKEYEDYLIAEGRLRRAILKKNGEWEPDWNDEEQEKYHFSIEFDKHRIEGSPIGAYAKSTDILDEVKEECRDSLKTVKKWLKNHN